MVFSSRYLRSTRKAGIIVFAVVAASVLVDFAGGVHARSYPAEKHEKPALPKLHAYDDAVPAKGKLLVASSTLADPWFRETVVLLISYDASGANGLIINRPTKVPLSEALTAVPGLKNRPDVVYYGGPVEGHRMFMLIRSDQKPEDSDNVFLNVYVSMSRKTLESMIGAHKTQKQFRVYSGYAGWLPGQLTREVLRGDWYVVDADADFIFEKKESELWRELIDRVSSIQVNRAHPTDSQ